MRAALVLVVLLAGAPAWGLPVSLGVSAGVAAETSPARAAPAVDLSASIAMSERWFVGAAVSGWTFKATGTAVAGTQGALALMGGLRQPLGGPMWLRIGAGPAFAVEDAPTRDLDVAAGLWLAPALELTTRRKTLSVQLGGRGLWTADGLTMGATAGLLYTFR